MWRAVSRGADRLLTAAQRLVRLQEGLLFQEGDPGSCLVESFARVPRALSVGSDQWIATKAVEKLPGGDFLELSLTLDLPWRAARRWECSKLYYAVGNAPFTEHQIATFRPTWLRRPQTVRLVMPQALREATLIRLRIDPAPGGQQGRFSLHALRCVYGDDGSSLNSSARRQWLKERTRLGVQRSERTQEVQLDHLPHSLSLELTPRCNLTCSHCSSHGTPELHRQHNRAAELSIEQLERLGRDVFPSLTSIGIVGRGEPLAVSRPLWDRFCALLQHHEVFLAMVTNGTYLKERISPALLPRIETLNISIDGNTPETFARNRGGASLDTVLDNLRHFHDARRASDLARVPRLGFSWTLKRNNVAEFPRFVERVAELDADLVYARHLLTFHKRDADQSVVSEPSVANPHLREAYALLERYGIPSHSPPLAAEDAGPTTALPAAELIPNPTLACRSENAAPAPARAPSRGCIFIWRTAVVLSDGEIPTCSAPFAAIAGHLREASFEQVWNGTVFAGVRGSLNTAREWDQCRSCWFREGHYHEQRAEAAAQRLYDLKRPARMSGAAWDFTAQEDDLELSLRPKRDVRD